MVENRAYFIPHLYLAPPQGVTPSEFRADLGVHKTRMNGLSCGEEIMTIRSAVLIPCQRVTDRRTDRRTDVQPISITCFSIADARKNQMKLKIVVFVGYVSNDVPMSRCRMSKITRLHGQIRNV